MALFRSTPPTPLAYLIPNHPNARLNGRNSHPNALFIPRANQSLGAEYLVKERKSLSNTVHRVPEVVDREIARLKLQAMGSNVDVLTAAQQKYLASWDMGT